MFHWHPILWQYIPILSHSFLGKKIHVICRVTFDTNLQISQIMCQVLIYRTVCSQSVLSQHLDWHPTNTLSTSLSTLDRQSVCLPSVEWLLCINQHSMTCLQKLLDFWPTVHWDVHRVLTEVSIEYRSRVDQGYWFRVSINTWPWTLWVHMIQLLCVLLPSNWTLLKCRNCKYLCQSSWSYLLVMIIFSAHQICWSSWLCSLWNKEQ